MSDPGAQAQRAALCDQFLAIMDAYPEQLYVVDPDSYELLWANRRFTDQLGQNPIGQKCYRVLHDFDSPCSFCTNRILLETGAPHEWEAHNQKWGRDYYLTDQLITWPDGRIVRFEMAVDVTARKAAEREALFRMEEFARLFRDVPISLWVEDLSLLKPELEPYFELGAEALRQRLVVQPSLVGEWMGMVRYVDVNPFTLSLFEVPDLAGLVDLRGRVFGDLFISAFIELLASLVDGSLFFKARTQLSTAQGKPLHVEMSARLPERDSDWSHVYLSVADISEIRGTREELDQALFDLGERVKELSCLHRASELLSDVNLGYREVLGELVELIRRSWQFPGETAVRIRLFRFEATTRRFAESEYQQRCEITLGGNRVGELEVFFLGRLKRGQRSAFLSEEQVLLNTLAKDLEKFVVRKQTMEDLQSHRERLEEKVLERTEALELANNRLQEELSLSERRAEVIARQGAEILKLSTPVMSVWPGILLAPLIGHLDGARAERFTEGLLANVASSQTAVAIIDVSGVGIIDTQTGQSLLDAVQAVNLLGCQVILTGIRGRIAQTLVQLGIDLSTVRTYSSLAAGLKIAITDVQAADAA